MVKRLFYSTLIVFSFPIFCQSQDTTRAFALYQQADSLSKATNYEVAAERYRTSARAFKDIGFPKQYLNALGNAAIAINSAGEYQTAITWANEGFSKTQDLQPLYPAQRAKLWKAKADAHWRLGQLNESEKSYLKSLDLFKEAYGATHGSVAGIYSGLANLIGETGDYESANSYGRKAITTYLAAGDTLHKGLATAYSNMATKLAMMGRADTAMGLFESALKIKHEILGTDHPSTAFTYMQMGIAYLEMYQVGKAAHWLEKAQNVYKKTLSPTHPRLFYIHQNLGRVARWSQQYEKAIIHHEKALRIAEEGLGGSPAYVGSEYHNIAINKKIMGEFNDALTYYRKALAVLETADRVHPMHLARTRHELAILYLDLGKIDSSFYHLRQAKELLATNPEEYADELASVDISEGIVYKENHEYDKALASIQKGMVRMRAEELNLPHLEREAALTLSNIYSKQSKYASADSAIAPYWSMIQKNTEGEMPVLDRFHFAKERGDNYLRQFQNEKPEPSLLKKVDESYAVAWKAVQEMRNGAFWDQDQLAMQALILDLQEKSMTSSWLNRKKKGLEAHFNELYSLLEEQKASLLKAATQQGELAKVHNVPAFLIRQEDSLRKENWALGQALSELLEYPDGEEKAIDDLMARRQNIQYHRDSLLTVFKHSFPTYVALLHAPKAIPAKQVASQLASDQLLVSFFWGKETLFVTGMTRSGKWVHQRALDASLKGMVNEYNLLVRKMSMEPAEFQTFKRLGHKLYKELLFDALAENGVSEVDKILIIPDGPLTFLPFEALLSAPDSPDQIHCKKLPFLIKEWEISYAPSASLWYQQQQTRKAFTSTYAGFAPKYQEEFLAQLSEEESFAQFRAGMRPLQGTQTEVSVANELFKGSAFIDEEATEAHFKLMKTSPAILHFAMHAFVDDHSPMFSKMLFASSEKDSTDDGMLHAHEIYSLSLNSQLAVLSACNTGSGQLRQGEGVLSLSHAFMYAGVPSVVVSLWRAADAPANELMQSFFKYLKGGSPKPTALRQAKLDYLKSADPLHAYPANWANFVAIGNTKPVNMWNPWSVLPWVLGFVVIGIFGVWLWRRKYH